MSASWSLADLLAELHHDIERQLGIVRRALGHSVTKGDASEAVWLELLGTYLPARYQALRAFVVDSRGEFSDQIDIVVRDRQYSPFIFNYQDQAVVPAESVYAVFEAKQSVDADLVRYAQGKAASVRRLHRTSLPIPHAGGVFEAKEPPPILAGILAFESDWSPPLGDALSRALATEDPSRRLDLGCIAARGTFSLGSGGTYAMTEGRKPATGFLFDLIARLQALGTAPMIDVAAYAAWLA
ncbi:MAG: hypothetical protein M3Q10_01045 [Chloroflexota bacterium]|nr:hypothetical protein [Chloroflexota bacterium]